MLIVFLWGRGVVWYPRRMGCVGPEFESQRPHSRDIVVVLR